MIKCVWTILFLSSALSIVLAQEPDNVQCSQTFQYTHPILFNPQIYHAKETSESINIDGELSDKGWNLAEWSNIFQDIEGGSKQVPERETKMKMLYDNDYLYIAAMLEEDHIWATLTEKDDIIFYDDDFEIFIDPDGDGHNYLEIEINALNTIWDLFLVFPYRVKSKQNNIMNWETKGLKTAIHIEGSINDPRDIDEFWSVEFAIPWSALIPFASPKEIPTDGDIWRINFSRVDWIMDIVGNQYVKRKGADGNSLSERNWVWSPTGYVNMHRPEDWGYLVFGETESLELPAIEHFKRLLWDLYHAVHSCKNELGTFPLDLSCIKLKSNKIEYEIGEFTLISGLNNFEISANYNGDTWTINQAGLLQKIRN